MNKQTKYVLVGCIGLLLGSVIAQGQGILSFSPIGQDSWATDTVQIKVTIPSFTLLQCEDGEKILVDNYGRLPYSGEPYLPSKILSLALPPGAEFIELSYETSEEIVLAQAHYLAPIPFHLIEETTMESTPSSSEIQFQQRVDSIYSSDKPYPPQSVEYVGSSFYRQYSLIDVRINPFVYRPLSGIVSYYPHITITVQYRMREMPQGGITDTNTAEHMAQNIIYNYDQAQQWYASSEQGTRGLYDFVIITLDSLTSAVEPLVEWEQEKGRTVHIVTVEDINETYNGYDLAADIRMFLREHYPVDQWGIQDVLLVGHRDEVPMRTVWQSLGSSSESKPETDFYYAELSLPDNASWDADGDHRYGEHSDPIDYYGEIAVGRIPWSDPEIVQHICEKSVAYEQNMDPSFKNNILLLAAFVDDQTDGATYMEYMANEEIHPWMSSWMRTRMYQAGSSYAMDYVLTHQNVVSVWSQGSFSVVAWNAHGSPYGSYVNGRPFITSDDCGLLNDEYPAIISAASCSNSDTDYLNIGQAMMRQGAVGFLGANKAAYYQTQWDHPNDGSDQSFKYFFTMAVTSGNYTQGQAVQYAIREMYVRNLWDSLKYETFIHGSLWGNPDLGLIPQVANRLPEVPTVPEGPSQVILRKTATYTIQSSDPDDDDLYYCWSWGDGSTEWVGPYASGQEISTDHHWTEEGTLEIRVKAKDINGGESGWSDPLQVTIPKHKLFSTPLLKRIIELLDSYLLNIEVLGTLKQR